MFCWLPSHVGIKGNENADKSAKSALNLPISDFKVPYTDFKSSVLTHIQSSWQSQWDGDHFNKLHSVKPALGEWYPSYRSVRQEEVIITRLRIGHSRLTHSWLLAREDAPECLQCNELLTIKHILLDCIDFQPILEKHYNADSMYNLFDTALIQLSPLSKRLVYTKSCDTFLIPLLTFCVNPYFYYLNILSSVCISLMGGLPLLGASYHIGDRTSLMGVF